MFNQRIKIIVLELRRCWGIFSKRKPMFFFLGVQDVENSKPVFDPDCHTELIIRDQYEDCNSGNMETYTITKKNTYKLK